MTRSKRLETATLCALTMVLLAPGVAGAETVELGSTADVDLVDIENGADVEIEQHWTVSDLKPSVDPIPRTLAGSLWEANATVQLDHGGIPVIVGFFARSGTDSYPVLWDVASPLGVNPAALPPGGSTTGKFYFDVTGRPPTSVAYLDADGELVEWGNPEG